MTGKEDSPFCVPELTYVMIQKATDDTNVKGFAITAVRISKYIFIDTPRKIACLKMFKTTHFLLIAFPEKKLFHLNTRRIEMLDAAHSHCARGLLTDKWK